jgi:hypothetical protein
MEKKQAEDILNAALALSKPIDTLIDNMQTLSEGDERKQMLKAAGDIMGILAIHIVFPIVKQYPELDPDK